MVEWEKKGRHHNIKRPRHKSLKILILECFFQIICSRAYHSGKGGRVPRSRENSGTGDHACRQIEVDIMRKKEKEKEKEREEREGESREMQVLAGWRCGRGAGSLARRNV